MKRVTLIFITLLVLSFTSSPIFACPIPVFEYAMSFWEEDLYEVVLLHYGVLSQEQEEALHLLQNSSRYGSEIQANIQFETIDLSKNPDNLRYYLEEEIPAETPWLIVQYPRITMINQTVWSGEFTLDNVNTLLDSPKRQEIANRLISGDSAVWVLVESGDRRKDNEIAGFVEGELRRLENTLILPDPTMWGYESQISSEISFSMIRISRNSPAENIFLEMLLNSEPDLKEFEDRPIVFPIYGRGLILYALVGEGINSWTLTNAGDFLVGPCSCQVKASNPGTDILMNIDWESKIGGTTFELMPPGMGVLGFIEAVDKVEEYSDTQ